jgi:hypothetical protein
MWCIALWCRRSRFHRFVAAPFIQGQTKRTVLMKTLKKCSSWDTDSLSHPDNTTVCCVLRCFIVRQNDNKNIRTHEHIDRLAYTDTNIKYLDRHTESYRYKRTDSQTARKTESRFTKDKKTDIYTCGEHINLQRDIVSEICKQIERHTLQTKLKRNRMTIREPNIRQTVSAEIKRHQEANGRMDRQNSRQTDRWQTGRWMPWHTTEKKLVTRRQTQ